ALIPARMTEDRRWHASRQHRGSNKTCDFAELTGHRISRHLDICRVEPRMGFDRFPGADAPRRTEVQHADDRPPRQHIFGGDRLGKTRSLERKETRGTRDSPPDFTVEGRMFGSTRFKTGAYQSIVWGDRRSQSRGNQPKWKQHEANTH